MKPLISPHLTITVMCLLNSISGLPQDSNTVTIRHTTSHFQTKLPLNAQISFSSVFTCAAWTLWVMAMKMKGGHWAESRTCYVVRHFCSRWETEPFISVFGCSWWRLSTHKSSAYFSSWKNLYVISVHPHPSSLNSTTELRAQAVVVMKSVSVVFCVRNMLFLYS